MLLFRVNSCIEFVILYRIRQDQYKYVRGPLQPEESKESQPHVTGWYWNQMLLVQQREKKGKQQILSVSAFVDVGMCLLTTWNVKVTDRDGIIW